LADLSLCTPLQGLGPVSEDTPCSRLPLEGSFETFLAARPKDLRRNLRRYREKAEAVGALRFEVTGAADNDLITTLIDLHAARWRRSGEPGTIESNRAGGFVRDAAAALARAGMLRIFTLRLNGCVVAILLAFRNETTIFSYLSAFDPEYESFGFGRELLAESIRYAYASGYRYWNFLRGAEPYKFSWGAQPIPKCRLRLDRSVFSANPPGL